jgi:hypothetical protein
MTIRELIEKLSELPQNARIEIGTPANMKNIYWLSHVPPVIVTNGDLYVFVESWQDEIDKAIKAGYTVV